MKRYAFDLTDKASEQLRELKTTYGLSGRGVVTMLIYHAYSDLLKQSVPIPPVKPEEKAS